jgi:hypothetical protein
VNRRPLRLRLGAAVLELLPDGRVLVVLPPTEMPFGCAMQATVVYPSLRACLAAVRRLLVSQHRCPLSVRIDRE